MMMNPRKVAVIGCGFVGASIAFALMQKGLFSEMVLIDANHAKAEGEAMDLSHGLPYTASMDIYAGDYKDVAGLRTDHYYRGSESETGRDASGSDREECRDFKIDRSADHGDGF